MNKYYRLNPLFVQRFMKNDEDILFYFTSIFPFLASTLQHNLSLF